MSGVILGAGFTGLSAGIRTNYQVFERAQISGGICSSYKIDGYKFELGGGHWIFGADMEILDFLNSFVTLKSYKRLSSVYFPDMDLYVPYPIQNHLSYLENGIGQRALEEIISLVPKDVDTMAEWLELNFGRTLCELFFFPFHELYTAGLYTKIAPQDKFKTPIDKSLIIKGAKDKTPPVGYNVTFVYPYEGLDKLAEKMALKCDVHYNKKAIKIDLKRKRIFFEDGTELNYSKLISTIPLNRLYKIAALDLGDEPDPYTSVLVINIGAKRGMKCPDDHWLYIPNTKTGFHRVGFYSNVDPLFLPESSKDIQDRVSIYVEMAFKGGSKPSDLEINRIKEGVVRELQDWKFIEDVDVVDPTWIEVAYTWEWPNSNWKYNTLSTLKSLDVISIGRYGKWKFQGIAESIRDGLDLTF